MRLVASASRNYSIGSIKRSGSIIGMIRVTVEIFHSLVICLGLHTAEWPEATQGAYAFPPYRACFGALQPGGVGVFQVHR